MILCMYVRTYCSYVSKLSLIKQIKHWLNSKFEEMIKPEAMLLQNKVNIGIFMKYYLMKITLYFYHKFVTLNVVSSYLYVCLSSELLFL